MAAVNANNSSAIEALGQKGAAAHAAVPLLLERCQPGKGLGLIQSTALALARIAPEDPRVLKAVVVHLARQPRGNLGEEYIRSGAIKALAEMKSHALPAVPALLKVLTEKPSSAEVYYLLDALRQIGADPAVYRPALANFHSSDSMLQESVERFKNTGSRGAAFQAGGDGPRRDSG